MTLASKLTIGLLDEDNPLKSFYRLKPLLIEEDGRFVPVDAEEMFPEEGYIRIVPDKNEMMMFKVRMHQLGRYCALDLRKYFSDTDKIRVNKNYIVGGPEHNKFIVYSDVIGRSPTHRIAEILECNDEPMLDKLRFEAPMPGTVYVMIKREGELSGPWSWSRDESGMLNLNHAVNQPFNTIPMIQVNGKMLDVPLANGVEKMLMYDLSDFDLNELSTKEYETVIGNDVFGAPPIYVVSNMRESMGDRPVVPPSYIRPHNLQYTTYYEPPEDDDDGDELYPHTGPRHGRSLQDAIDEQWTRQKTDLTGRNFVAQGSMRPLISPVDRAAAAIGSAWQIDEMHDSLITEILKHEDLRESLKSTLEIDPEIAEVDAQLNRLEARRRALAEEVDRLQKNRVELKADMLAEMQIKHQNIISDHKARIKALESETDANERVADAARRAAGIAGSLLSETVEQLDDRLKTAMIVDRLLALRDAPREADVKSLKTYAPTSGELILSVYDHMNHAGYQVKDEQIINILSCMMCGHITILSGPTGCGKTEMVRKLASALGLSGDAGRFAQVSDVNDEEVAKLLKQNDGKTPLLLLIDDFNTGDCEQRILDIVALQERAQAHDIPLYIMLTAQDAPEGEPVPARLLSRSFLIRLAPTPNNAPWQPEAPLITTVRGAVELGALKEMFEPMDDLPGHMIDRLDKLRNALDGFDLTIDRRTLGELWQYCATARQLMHCSSQDLMDLALSQRVIPTLLASMEMELLRQFPKMIVDMPRCLDLMEQPLPLPPL